MERLTNHFEYCDFIDCKYRNPELAKKNQCDFFNMTSMEKCHDKKIYEKLKEYEDLEEQGRLIVLPCKVGDTIYITSSRYRHGRIESWINTGKFRISDMEELGKHIFLTKAEAEKALEEMEE